MNTQNYAVNIRVGLANPARVNISQGDTGRTLAFSLYDGLSPFTPPTGSTVTIVGRKPSKLGFSEACTVSGNVATVTTTLAMTQEAGKFPVELRIEANGESIGTANFTMYIEPSPHPDGTTDGTHATVDNLQTQIGNLANLATTAKTNLVSAINEAAQSGGVVIDDTLTQTGQAADAKKTGDEISAIKADLEDLDERVDALESGGGGSGLTESIKTALMNVVSHIAWDDDDPTGQTYITALYDALYPPAPPASLTSITAIYTQSGTVYATDSLNDLKSDLTVTAHYSDSTSHAVTDYTLSGTLAVGTSTITVSYGGKTTTFTVTVTAGALHPLENGSHTFTTNNRVLTVTRGSHFVYEAPNATSAGTPKGAYLNLSTVSDNDTSATTADNVLVNDPLFTFPANAQVVFEVKNISFTNLGTSGSKNKYAFNMRNGATSLGMSSGDRGISDTADISFTKTFDVDTPVTCIFLYASNQFARFEADISLTVNNVRWI